VSDGPGCLCPTLACSCVLPEVLVSDREGSSYLRPLNHCARAQGNMNKADQIVEQMRQCTQQAALLAMRTAARTLGAKSIFIAPTSPGAPRPPPQLTLLGMPRARPARSESWGTTGGAVWAQPQPACARRRPWRCWLRGRIPGSDMLDELDPQVNDLDPGEKLRPFSLGVGCWQPVWLPLLS